MFKSLTLAILMAAFAVSPALAQNPDGSITLTPSKLYEMIEVEKKKSTHQTEILKLLRERLNTLESRGDVQSKRHERQNERLSKVEEQTAYIQAKPIGELQRRVLLIEERLAESERKLAGVQKQITILHSKKADK